MNWTIAIPIVAAVTILLMGLGVRYMLSKPELRRRLEGVRADTTMTREERLRLPFMDRVVLPVLDRVGSRMKRFASKQDQLQQLLIQSGYYPRLTTSRLEGMRWVAALVFSMVGAGYCLLAGVINSAIGIPALALPELQLFDTDGLMAMGAGFLLGYVVPVQYLGRQKRARQGVIQRALPSSIDLISVGAEAGMGFDQVLNYVRRRTKGPLSDEFGNTLNEIRLGKTRIEALNNLVYRTGVDDMKTFVGAITQSFQLGTSIVETLRIQADSIRIKQRQRAQEQAMKAPVKMLIPLVFFIFPALLVVILGPAAIMIFTSGF
jgi:tight adherence protein C